MKRGTDIRLTWIALLCVVGQLASSTHLVLVRHAACPEHGELLHGDELHSGHGGEVGQAPSDAAAWTAAPTALEQHDEHEHCSVPCERRALAVLPASSVRFIPGALADALLGEQRATVRGTPLLALAPKQSPPRA